MQVLQPICLINNSAKLCLVKKIPPVTNTTVRTFQDGWLKLPEEHRHFTPTWKLQSSPFVCCYQDVFLLTAPITGCHTRQVCPRKGCHHSSNIFWWPPFWVYSNICHPATPPELVYDTSDIERKSMQSNCFWSLLLQLSPPSSLLCSSLPLLLLSKCFRLLGDSVKISLQWLFGGNINCVLWIISRPKWMEVFFQPVVLLRWWRHDLGGSWIKLAWIERACSNVLCGVWEWGGSASASCITILQMRGLSHIFQELLSHHCVGIGTISPKWLSAVEDG